MTANPGALWRIFEPRIDEGHEDDKSQTDAVIKKVRDEDLVLINDLKSLYESEDLESVDIKDVRAIQAQIAILVLSKVEATNILMKQGSNK